LLEETVLDVDPGFEFTVTIPAIEAGVARIGFPIADIGIFSPQLDTPALPDFNGFSSRYFDGQSMLNVVSPGARQLLEWGIVSEGVVDTDVSRLDIDIDVLTVAAGMPFGLAAGIGPFNGVDYISVEGNILDLDSANYRSFNEELEFLPNLKVTLRFNQPTLVEAVPGSGDFVEVTTLSVDLTDDLTELKIVCPEQELRIDPTYSLADNRFINDTDLIFTPTLQATYFQLKIGGLIPDMLGSAFGIPTNFAALQATLPFVDQVKLADLNWLDDSSAANFALGGFEDVVGESISVRVAGMGGRFRRGDADASGVVDFTDAISSLNNLFIGEVEIDCVDAADTDDSGAFDLTDPIVLLGALFLGDATVPAPGLSDCGTDPTMDTLACESVDFCS
jgi:hypothetical protein